LKNLPQTRAVEWLKVKALSSSPSTEKKKREKKDLKQPTVAPQETRKRTAN
jgi:hypothetical protein